MRESARQSWAGKTKDPRCCSTPGLSQPHSFPNAYLPPAAIGFLALLRGHRYGVPPSLMAGSGGALQLLVQQVLGNSIVVAAAHEAQGSNEGDAEAAKHAEHSPLSHVEEWEARGCQGPLQKLASGRQPWASCSST